MDNCDKLIDDFYLSVLGYLDIKIVGAQTVSEGDRIKQNRNLIQNLRISPNKIWDASVKTRLGTAGFVPENDFDMTVFNAFKEVLRCIGIYRVLCNCDDDNNRAFGASKNTAEKSLKNAIRHWYWVKNINQLKNIRNVITYKLNHKIYQK